MSRALLNFRFPSLVPPSLVVPSLVVPSLVVPSLVVPSLVVPSLVLHILCSMGQNGPWRPWQRISPMKSDLIGEVRIGEVQRSSEKNYLTLTEYFFLYFLARRVCFDDSSVLPFALWAS
jgi:hypothetical protein